MEEGVPIESRMISKRIESAQKAVETQNFESRKHVLEYDDVMNKQREAVYGLRRQLMEGVDQKQLVAEDYVSTILSNILDEHAPEKQHPEQWNLNVIFTQLYDVFGVKLNEGPDAIDATRLNRHELGEAIFEKVRARYDFKEKVLGAPAMRYHERIVMLSVLDGLWKDHLLAMDHLKEGIGLRGYAQQDPLVAYKRESFEMFEAMMMQFQQDTARHLFRMQIIGPDGTPIESSEQMLAAQLQRSHTAGQQALPLQPPGTEHAPVPIHTRAPSTTIDELEKEFQRKKRRELEQARAVGSGESSAPAQRVTGEKVGRNDPCPCGSGKKYKKCHGAAA
jgi:preprotein translocase subunit SecA